MPAKLKEIIRINNDKHLTFKAFCQIVYKMWLIGRIPAGKLLLYSKTVFLHMTLVYSGTTLNNCKNF
jgi:hypothetical protein